MLLPDTAKTRADELRGKAPLLGRLAGEGSESRLAALLKLRQLLPIAETADFIMERRLAGSSTDPYLLWNFSQFSLEGMMNR